MSYSNRDLHISPSSGSKACTPHAKTHTCTQAEIYMHVSSPTYIYIYMHACIHTHTHTHNFLLRVEQYNCTSVCWSAAMDPEMRRDDKLFMCPSMQPALIELDDRLWGECITTLSELPLSEDISKESQGEARVGHNSLELFRNSKWTVL